MSMFSKSKINEPIDTPGKSVTAKPETQPDKPLPPSPKPVAAQVTSRKSTPSVISADLKVVGNLVTEGDLQIEGTIEGDIRANLLTIGQSATVKGEIRANDVIVNGTVKGRLRGLKVTLSETARVTGDIVHSRIAIEAGADFEGSVHRSETPLEDAAVSSASNKVTELTANTISSASAAGAAD